MRLSCILLLLVSSCRGQQSALQASFEAYGRYTPRPTPPAPAAPITETPSMAPSKAPSMAPSKAPKGSHGTGDSGAVTVTVSIGEESAPASTTPTSRPTSKQTISTAAPQKAQSLSEQEKATTPPKTLAPQTSASKGGGGGGPDVLVIIFFVGLGVACAVIVSLMYYSFLVRRNRTVDKDHSSEDSTGRECSNSDGRSQETEDRVIVIETDEAVEQDILARQSARQWEANSDYEGESRVQPSMFTGSMAMSAVSGITGPGYMSSTDPSYNSDTWSIPSMELPPRWETS